MFCSLYHIHPHDKLMLSKHWKLWHFRAAAQSSHTSRREPLAKQAVAYRSPKCLSHNLTARCPSCWCTHGVKQNKNPCDALSHRVLSCCCTVMKLLHSRKGEWKKLTKESLVNWKLGNNQHYTSSTEAATLLYLPDAASSCPLVSVSLLSSCINACFHDKTQVTI